ncbi:transposase [Amycolatopsis vastitatis]|uniref:transposase n=1 Tax=Amycolatopsis vastitatis TaxID=1905142 RepID=UPI00196B22AD
MEPYRKAARLFGQRCWSCSGSARPALHACWRDIGGVGRFVDKGRFASWNGTAPLEASSGDRRRHRLSRAGNRRINRVLHVMAIVQLRHDTPAVPATGGDRRRARRAWKRCGV